MARIFPTQDDIPTAEDNNDNVEPARKLWFVEWICLAVIKHWVSVFANIHVLVVGMGIALVLGPALIGTRNALMAPRPMLEDRIIGEHAASVGRYVEEQFPARAWATPYRALIVRSVYLTLTWSPLVFMSMGLPVCPEYTVATLANGILLTMTAYNYIELEDGAGGSFITYEPRPWILEARAAFVFLLLQYIAMNLAAWFYYVVVYRLRLAMSRWSFGERAIRLAGMDPIPMDRGFSSYLQRRHNNATMLRCAETIVRAHETMERIRGDDGADFQ
jgi:hypothetical protein